MRSTRVPLPPPPQLFGSGQNEIYFRICIKIFLLMRSAILPHLFGQRELRPAATIGFTKEASNFGGHLRLAGRSHTLWQSLNFEVFKEIDSQFAHKVNAARCAEGTQSIELEKIGRGGFFAKFLFAGCAETLNAIV